MEKYNRILNSLRMYRPDHGSADELKERIINQIDSGSVSDGVKLNIIDLVFGWADIVWLRRTMVIASFAVVIFFATQQYLIFDRIDSLEKRMTGVSTENILEFQKENMHANSVMYSMSEEIFTSDSVKVSSRDLNSLVRSYRELQGRYDKLREAIDQGVPETTDKKNRKFKL